MNFNSFQFAVFFCLVLMGYALVWRSPRAREAYLLAVSYIFYMSWNATYALLILGSTVVDFNIARRLSKAQRDAAKRWWLVCSLVFNLGVLAVFKYFNFFIDMVDVVTIPIGVDLSALHHDLLLPVGISFYTFQTLSYTIDVYRGHLKPERNFVSFALFVSFFPQLVAGPIVRASQFLPQLARGPIISQDRLDSGLVLIFRGLFKKIVIADLLAGLGVDAVFADPSRYSSIDLLFAL